MIIFLSILCIIFTSIIVALGVIVYKLSNTIFTLEDQVEESLDIIDECYRKIFNASQIPVLYDEPVIKELINDIKTSREALLLIANKITIFSQEDKK